MPVTATIVAGWRGWNRAAASESAAWASLTARTRHAPADRPGARLRNHGDGTLRHRGRNEGAAIDRMSRESPRRFAPVRPCGCPGSGRCGQIRESRRHGSGQDVAKPARGEGARGISHIGGARPWLCGIDVGAEHGRNRTATASTQPPHTRVSGCPSSPAATSAGRAALADRSAAAGRESVLRARSPCLW